jgi:hypothetical protein
MLNMILQEKGPRVLFHSLFFFFFFFFFFFLFLLLPLVISAANLDAVCPDGTNPVDGPCEIASNPAINITGPGSGDALRNETVMFPLVGDYAVVNPTFCRSESGFETVACSAKCFINVVAPAETPAPGSTIIGKFL